MLIAITMDINFGISVTEHGERKIIQVVTYLLHGAESFLSS